MLVSCRNGYRGRVYCLDTLDKRMILSGLEPSKNSLHYSDSINLKTEWMISVVFCLILFFWEWQIKITNCRK